MFYEHQVHMHLMRAHWYKHKPLIGTLRNSYDNVAALRRAGVRMHSWPWELLKRRLALNARAALYLDLDLTPGIRAWWRGLYGSNHDWKCTREIPFRMSTKESSSHKGVCDSLRNSHKHTNEEKYWAASQDPCYHIRISHRRKADTSRQGSKQGPVRLTKTSSPNIMAHLEIHEPWRFFVLGFSFLDPRPGFVFEIVGYIKLPQRTAKFKSVSRLSKTLVRCGSNRRPESGI